jgi:hypothetical protein
MRETKEIKVGENIILLNTYITGREFREFQTLSYKSVSVNKDGGLSQEIKGEAINEAQDYLIKVIVVSFNGSSENMVNQILDLPVQQSEEILKEVNDIAHIDSLKKK